MNVFLRCGGAARFVLFSCAMALAGCSSVATVNEKAMLAGVEDGASGDPPDPYRFIRPVQTEYRVGPRDLLEIEVYELEAPNETKQLRTRVSQEGTVLVPLIGAVAVGGRTAPEIQDEIARRLGAEFLVDPNVTVVVAEHQARRVTVLGAVQAPGTFHLKDNSTTLVDVLALAGGPNDKAGSVVYVVRERAPFGSALDASAGADGRPAPAGESAGAAGAAMVRGEEHQRIVKVDLVDLVERGDLSANCVLDDGDVVHVPPAAQFFVMGKVHEGGAFPLRGRITLLRAIALAGGLTPEATPSSTVLVRTTPNGRVTMPLDLGEVEEGSVSDLEMQADDVLIVSESGGDALTRGIGSFVRGLFNISYGLR